MTWNFSYNGSGRISQITESPRESVAPSPVSRFTYSYDEIGRLTSAVKSTTTDDVHWTTDWTNSLTYDRYANMLTNQLVPGSTTTLAVNAANNRLSSYTTGQGTTSVGYDLAGNMTTEGTKSYTFDGAGRLKSMTGPGGTQGTYRFDAMGRRVKRTWNYSDPWGTRSGSAIYIHGPSDELLVEYKNETVSYAGTENTTTYNIQMGGQLVVRRVIGTGQPPLPRTEWLHRNHLNQIVGADWGSDIFSTGQIAGYSQPYGSGGSDQFQGHKDDPESALHYNLARSYSPGMARWISADPITGRVSDPQSLNKYAYVRNDPINLVDLDGPIWVTVCATVSGSTVCDKQWFSDPPRGDVVLLSHNNPGAADMKQLRMDRAQDRWNRFWNGVNTDIGEAKRNEILANARGDDNSVIKTRAGREDCNGLLAGVITMLGNQLNSTIHNVADLLSQALSSAKVDLYGAVNAPSGRERLRSGGSAFARTIGNTIYLGENFFDPKAANSYGSVGGDQTSTLIHELFHLAGVSANGRNLTEGTLNQASLDAGYGNNFGAAIRNKCGPR